MTMTRRTTTMLQLRYLRSWYLLVLSLTAIIIRTAVAADDDECSLYLAESSTSTAEEPKWGVFAGVDFEANVPLGSPDVAIQIHHLMANAADENDSEDDEYETKSLERKSVEIMERYTWVADSSGAFLELEDGKINTAIPGPALLAAFNGKLTNAAFNHTTSYFRPAWGEVAGKNHPGRGASSHFFNVGLKTLEEISAGYEVFLDYGENFDNKEVKLTSTDHKKLDLLVDNMIQFMAKYKDELNETSKLEIYNFLIHDVMSAAAGSKKGKLVADVLPDNPDDLPKVKEAGGSMVFGSPNIKKDLDHLRKEGFCMDNLRMGPSTIPHAGRGAFARRELKKGTTIAPVPLLHIPDQALVNMHNLTEGDDDDEEDMYRTSKEVVDQQLFLNYCLGHPESSMLFFPTGAIVSLVNHDAKKANAKLVWSKHRKHQSHWFDKTPEELAEEENIYVGLLMELVAMRDIKQDEEILMDYGKEWQVAWDAHVKSWNNKVASGELSSDWPLRALDLNEEYRTTSKAFRTPTELKKDPYPPVVDTYCFLALKIKAEEDDEEPKPWVEPSKGSAFTSEHLYPCTVKERKQLQGGAYNYTVVTGREFPLTVTQVPQKAILFMDKPEVGDQFTTSAFRHAIGIPDDVYPKGPWRDLANKS